MLYTNKDLGNFAKDPAVVEFGGSWWLYHSVLENRVLGVGIARSEDGENFTYIGKIPLTLDCEKHGIGAPGAIVYGGKIHLFYQTYGNGKLDAICHAVSSDGVNFIKDKSNPVFAPREPWTSLPGWSSGRAIDADVCIHDGKLILYFATRDKDFKRQIVGAAYQELTPELDGEFRFSPEIVLEPELDWERDCIEAPAALERDGKVYLFYAGSYNCAPQQIGCAVSDDGFHFRRLFIQAPFLACGKPGEWNSSESGHPYIYEANDGRIWLYYQGSPDGGKSWYLSRREVSFDGGSPRLI
ncbi:MAG: family 43 glycosylhydrolase [Candidatus Flemingiibacterium sp.]